jgi:phosphate butyryltransferase
MTRAYIVDFNGLLAAAARIGEKTILVANPGNAETFDAIKHAQAALHTRFVLVGDEEVIGRGLSGPGIDRTRISIHHQKDVNETVRTCMTMLRNGQAEILMKGSVDTATLLKAVLEEKSGLRTGRLLSDVFVLEYPPREGSKFIMITDGGITPAPDLKNKVELINNAVEVAHALGTVNPKVAVLSATEFIVPALQSTLDAAALSKMNDRGQIKGCIVDGPLALDNAISPDAVREKGITSPVAGRAEILLAANIESANSLAKSTTLFAGLRLAHVIIGAQVPILIPSRSDKSDAKLLSIALGMIMSDYAREFPDR